jgi:hypothetical protein
MKRLGLAALIATGLWLGCADMDHDHRYARNSCEAPAVGVCAGCDVSCHRGDQPSCTPGRSVPAQGTAPGYCSEEAICRCRE